VRASPAARGLPAAIAAVILPLPVAAPAALAQPTDYTGLLIRASDLVAPQAFTAATRALESAKATTDGYVHGVPDPIAVGAGGTTISGPSPDGSKGVTVLLFTEGRAFAELEFDGPPDDLVAPDFVADVGTKQDAAIKRGLAG
jgi:hypothetical protein